MNFECLLLEQAGGVATIKLNRPQRLNALTQPMLAELREALRVVLRAGECRAVLLTGAGRGFCAGSDITAPRTDVGHDVDANMRDHLHATVLMVAECPLPVVAAVHGPAVGAGSSLALACDIVVAGASAYFQQAFSNLGLVPDCGGSWLLPRLLGPGRAAALLMLGERLPAAEAADWGLVYRCVPDETLLAEASSIASRLAERPTVALELTKRLVRQSATASLRDQMLLEQEYQRIARRSEDALEARAAFREKRSPQFKGR